MESDDYYCAGIVFVGGLDIVPDCNCTAPFFHPDTAEYITNLGADSRDKIRSIRPYKKEGEVE